MKPGDRVQFSGERFGIYLYTDSNGLVVIRPVGTTVHVHLAPADVRPQ